MTQTSVEQKQERRQRILDAAISVFSRRGFADAKVSEIARASGVGHGTVFLYFPTKEELFRAAVLEPLAALEEEFAPGGGGSPLERIRDLERRTVRAVAGRDRYVLLSFMVLSQRERFPDLAEEILAFSRRFQDRLKPIVREGQEAGELAPGDPTAVVCAYFSYLVGLGLMLSDEPAGPFWDLMQDMGMRLFAPTT